MPKRKLIEHHQTHLIECDTPGCDYKIAPPNTDDIPEKYKQKYLDSVSATFIDHPCPRCGGNLLTMEDFLLSVKVMKKIDWINRWFSWLTYFLPRSKKTIEVKVHDGIKIKNNG